MDENKSRALVSKPPSSVEKAEPGTKRVLSAMVLDTLAMANKDMLAPAQARFRIGVYEWCEPDYRQILLWAKALGLEPQEVIRRLLTGKKPRSRQQWHETTFVGGSLVKVNWDFELLPLEVFEWVDNLVMTHLAFSSTPERMPSLALRLPSLTHLSCTDLLLTELDLSGVPMLTELKCSHNELTNLNLTDVPKLTMLDCITNRLTELHLSDVLMLTKLRCGGNPLGKLDLSGVPMLTAVWCPFNQLDDIDLSHVPMLTRLECIANQLTKLDLFGVPKLTILSCDDNKLTELDLSHVPMLTNLSCTGNQLAELDLSRVPMLGEIVCKENPIKFLDIRSLHKVRFLAYDEDSTRLIQRPDQHF